MTEEQIVTPPVRTPLMEEGGHEPNAKTATRDWWLYWNQLTLRLNEAMREIAAIQKDLAELEQQAVTGASGLTHVNAVTKVGAAGKIVEGVITDDGKRVRLDTGASPANSQFGVTAGGGILGIQTMAAGNAALEFDNERVAGVQTARDTSIASIVKNTGKLFFGGSVGNTPGSAIVPFNIYLTIDLSTGTINAGTGASDVYFASGQAVVGIRRAAVTAPSGGPVIDTQARAAITDLINRLSASTGGHGLIA